MLRHDLRNNRNSVARHSAPKTTGKKIAAIAVAFSLLAGGAGAVVMNSLGTSSEANALQIGPGIYRDVGGVQYGVGGFFGDDGSILYCAELGIAAVFGPDPLIADAESLPAIVDATMQGADRPYVDINAPAVSGLKIKHINYVLTHWGQTLDNTQAAAVQLAIWEIRGEGANAEYHNLLNHFRGEAGPEATALASEMVQEAVNYFVSLEAPSDFRITAGQNPYSGVLHADIGTTSVTLTNGVFLQNNSNTITFPGGTTEVVSLPFRGQPTDEWDRYYTITANGTYLYTDYSSSVPFGKNPNEQGIIQAVNGAIAIPGNYTAQLLDPDTIWSPVLTSNVESKFVQEGESFSDTVTFSVADDSNPWRIGYRNGEEIFAPIKATGTLYGPFLSDPAENPSPLPPNFAPVAATAEITTTVEQGPGTYAVENVGESIEAGYYSWVWNIEFDNQLPSVMNPGTGESSLPLNYFFTDGFGQVTETQITPSDISFTTELSENELALGDYYTDNIHVTLNKGGWLQTEGERTPFTLVGVIYGTDERPVQSAEAPADAEIIGTTTAVINEPNQTVTSEQLQIPYDIDANFVTLQWCLLDENQPANSVGKAKEFCDDFGMPSETAEILKPTVSTQALSDAPYKGEIYDDALVEGTIPTNADSFVRFIGYLTPVAGEPKYDENWDVIVDPNTDEPVLWTQDEIDASPNTVQPVIHTGSVPVSEIGTYRSELVTAKSTGEIYWSEIYYVVTPDDEEIIIHEGPWGVPTERTEIAHPTVTTVAKSGHVGQEIYDTATVAGLVSENVEYKITFKAYERIEGEQMVCSVENELAAFEDSEGVIVTGPGEYTSKKVVATEEMIGLGGYVETLTMTEDGVETIIHVGDCGEPSENFAITPAPETNGGGNKPGEEDGPKPGPLDEGTKNTAVGMLALGGLVGAGLLVAGGAMLASSRRNAVK